MLGKILLTTKMENKPFKETSNLIEIFICEPSIDTGGLRREFFSSKPISFNISWLKSNYKRYTQNRGRSWESVLPKMDVLASICIGYKS